MLDRPFPMRSCYGRLWWCSVPAISAWYLQFHFPTTGMQCHCPISHFFALQWSVFVSVPQHLGSLAWAFTSQLQQQKRIQNATHSELSSLLIFRGEYFFRIQSLKFNYMWYKEVLSIHSAIRGGGGSYIICLKEYWLAWDRGNPKTELPLLFCFTWSNLYLLSPSQLAELTSSQEPGIFSLAISCSGHDLGRRMHWGPSPLFETEVTLLYITTNRYAALRKEKSSISLPSWCLSISSVLEIRLEGTSVIS